MSYSFIETEPDDSLSETDTDPANWVEYKTKLKEKTISINLQLSQEKDYIQFRYRSWSKVEANSLYQIGEKISLQHNSLQQALNTAETQCITASERELVSKNFNLKTELDAVGMQQKSSSSPIMKTELQGNIHSFFQEAAIQFPRQLGSIESPNNCLQQ